jgi:hypothetical protein
MKKGKKQDFNKLLMNIGMAAGGGIGAELLTDFIAQQSPEIIQKNPKMTEIIPIAAGSALLYFMGEKTAPLAYGMIGSGASGFADDIMKSAQGFQRVQYMNGAQADEMAQGIVMIERMQGIGFESVATSEDDSNGMSEY